MTKETLRTITVRELIERLEGESPDAKVIFSTDYGDYIRTQQALPLRGELDTVTIRETAYSRSGFAVVEPDEDGDLIDDESDETFLLIR